MEHIALAINTDHSLVSAKISNPGLPEQGRGQWQMPMFLLKDREFQDEAKKLAKKLENNIDSLGKRTHLANHKPHTRSSKPKSKNLAIRMSPNRLSKDGKKTSRLEAELAKAWNEPDRSEPEKMALASSIQDKLNN